MVNGMTGRMVKTIVSWTASWTILAVCVRLWHVPHRASLRLLASCLFILFLVVR